VIFMKQSAQSSPQCAPDQSRSWPDSGAFSGNLDLKDFQNCPSFRL
jgi:hypothetical protein